MPPRGRQDDRRVELELFHPFRQLAAGVGAVLEAQVSEGAHRDRSAHAVGRTGKTMRCTHGDYPIGPVANMPAADTGAQTCPGG